jgi:hypothetical protein
MLIHLPCYITARLMVGIDVNNATLSIEYGGTFGPYGRHKYKYALDFDPPLEGLPYGYENDNLSGTGGLQDGLIDLLAFLSAAAESYRFSLQHPEEENDNADLFPKEIMEWACQNQDAISMVETDMEVPNLIEE